MHLGKKPERREPAELSPYQKLLRLAKKGTVAIGLEEATKIFGGDRKAAIAAIRKLGWAGHRIPVGETGETRPQESRPPMAMPREEHRLGSGTEKELIAGIIEPHLKPLNLRGIELTRTRVGMVNQIMKILDSEGLTDRKERIDRARALAEELSRTTM